MAIRDALHACRSAARSSCSLATRFCEAYCFRNQPGAGSSSGSRWRRSGTALALAFTCAARIPVRLPVLACRACLSAGAKLSIRPWRPNSAESAMLVSTVSAPSWFTPCCRLPRSIN